MLCISAAKSYTPEAFTTTADGSEVVSQSTLKVSGFNFDCRPSVKADVLIMQRKFKSRVWSLRHF